MSLALTFAGLWAAMACLLALFPAGRAQRPLALALIGAGIPILGFATYSGGPLAGMAMLAGGAVLFYLLPMERKRQTSGNTVRGKAPGGPEA